MQKLIMIKWVKPVALICCLFNVSVMTFLALRFERIIAYYEKLDSNCSDVKLFFVSGMEYGAGLVTILFLFLLSLKVLISRQPMARQMPPI